MTDNETFPGRLAIQQRVLPSYRVPFFSTLAGACRDGLSVFAGQPGVGESIEPAGIIPGAEMRRGRNVYLFPRRILLVWQPGLLEWLEAAQPAALIVEANPRNLSLARAAAWMHARRRPVVGWGLGAPRLTGIGAGILERQRRNLLQAFDAVIAYSARGAQEFRAAGIPEGRVFTAPNAVSPRPAQPPADKPPTFAGGTAGGQAVVLFVGRLQPRKRVDRLLQACAALPEAQQPALRIVGDGPARGELEELARQVYPRAEFVGARHGAELEAFYREADLFVLPGTGGLAVQQAMAHGLPVVVAEADGTQADLVRPANGWCIGPGEAAELAATLAEALGDPARLRRMGKASYAVVAEEINLERMVAVFIQALEAGCQRITPVSDRGAGCQRISGAD
jgi:glycosyltransferase involved in cell wall biosynthesis